MIAEPIAEPDTNPVSWVTVAIAGLLLLQFPPAVPLLLKNVEAPMQIFDAPVITPALTLFGVTVKVLNALTPGLIV